jgi:hypothetical protein
LKRRYWGRRFLGRGYFSTTNGAITEDIVLQYLEQHIADSTGASRQWFSSRIPVAFSFNMRLLKDPQRRGALV